MIFTLSKNKIPLMPVSEKRGHELLTQKKATIHKYFPFVIRLKKNYPIFDSKLTMKIRPGANVSKIALAKGNDAICFFEIVHKSFIIKQKLVSRASLRRSRRNRNTRYREPGVPGWKRKDGWLPPSLHAKVIQTQNIVKKLCNHVPVGKICLEYIKFDTQKMENPDISGVEYQQGELMGYEVREYLLEKWGRKCAYCGKENVPFTIDHIIPKKRGGTDRIGNLTLACEDCNKKKGTKTAAEFGFPDLLTKASKPLANIASLNSTRKAVVKAIKEVFDGEIEFVSAARTKKNRILFGVSKDFEASCVGKMEETEKPTITTDYIEVWKAIGRGNRQICQPDAYGFPRAYRSRNKVKNGLQTGDFCKFKHTGKGKFAGKEGVGRVTVKADGTVYIQKGKEQLVSGTYKYFKLLQHGDGWEYSKRKVVDNEAKE